MSILLAFVAGIITVLSPCVLPLLPVILASAVQEGRLRPWGVLSGFILSFAVITLLLATLVTGLGVNPEIIRTISGVILLIAGLVLAVPRFSYAFEMQTGGIAALSTRYSGRRRLPRRLRSWRRPWPRLDALCRSDHGVGDHARHEPGSHRRRGRW